MVGHWSDGTSGDVAGHITVLSNPHSVPEREMRKIITLLTLASVFAACDRPASEPEAAASAPEPAAAAVVEMEVSIYAAAVSSIF